MPSHQHDRITCIENYYHLHYIGVFMLAFHPAITLAAFLLAWASTVVPAWVAAKRKLRDKPASLLRAFHVHDFGWL